MKINDLFAQAKKDMMSQGGYRPRLLIEPLAGESMTLEFADFPYDSTFEKQKEFFARGREYGLSHVGVELAQIAFISEMWVSDNPVYDFPAQDPDRKEAIAICTYDIVGRDIDQHMWIAEVIRVGDTIDLMPQEEMKVDHNKLLYAFLAGFASHKMSDSELLQMIKRRMSKA
jgi:hypothetical protein